MPFALEADMLPSLRDALPALLVPSGPYAFACEVPDGSRVVDLMFASIDSGSQALTGMQPYADRLSRLSVAQTMVLALVWRERRVTSRRLSAMTFMTPDRIECEYLLPMEKAGLVLRESRSWVVGPWGHVRPSCFIAVEAKLKDWREALEQAQDNRARADLSYVALPRVDSHGKRAQIRERALEYGVGVIELESDGTAAITVRAQRTPGPICNKKWQLALRALADASQPEGRWSVCGGEGRA